MSESVFSVNPFTSENLERIGKYYVVSLAITIVSIIILLIVSLVLPKSPVIQWVAGIVIMLASTVAILSTYESWRHCKIGGEFDEI